MMFVAKNLMASRVNLIQNDYASGLPSPLSFLGLADTIVRQLDLEPWSGRALAILHSVDISEGRTKPEMEAKSGAFTPVETMEDLVGTVEVSVLIDLPGCDSAADVKSAMSGRRIAGGLIQNDEIDIQPVTSDGSAFRALRRGYAMVRPDTDRPKRRRISTGSEETLSEIAHTVFPVEREPGDGWIVPIAAGYRLLEDPTTAPKRIRTRNPSLPHVFAEPVLGIAELISVRNKRLTDLTKEGLSERLWSWDVRGDLVLGHPAYHPETPEASNKETISHG